MTELALYLTTSIFGHLVAGGALQPGINWAGVQEEAIHERFLSMDVSASVIASYCTDLDWREREEWFCIGWHEGETLVAEVRIPEPLSLKEQLVRLHVAFPDAPFDELAERVTYRRTVLRELDCPSLRRVLVAIPPIEFRGLDEPSVTICMDGPSYEFAILDPARRVRIRTGCLDETHSTWFWRASALLKECVDGGSNRSELVSGPQSAFEICGGRSGDLEAIAP